MENKSNIFEIEYSKKFPFILISKKNLFAIFFEAIFVGFLAFFMETLVDIIWDGFLTDQGFLCGPFIPMYAIVVFFVLLYIKTPKRSIKNVGIVFLSLFIGITVIEFAVGNIMELIVHYSLWCYDAMLPLSYGYISIVASLFWGVLGSAYYFIIVPLIKKIPDHIVDNDFDRLMIVVTFFLIFFTDLGYTIYRNIKNVGYERLYDIKLSSDLWLFIIGILLYSIAVTICGVLTYKRISIYVKGKYKWIYIYLYTFIVFSPVFSTYNYLFRHKGVLETLAIIGFLCTGFMIYYALSGILLFLVRILIYAFSKKEMWNAPKMKCYSLFCAVLCSLVICCIGVISLKNPKTIQLECGSGDHELNIVAVSDLHYGTCGGIVDITDCVEDINRLKPDVVFLLGDTIDDKVENIDREHFFNEIAKIEAPLGVYAIGGNHEYESNGFFTIESFYANTTVKLLLDEEIILDNSIRVVGRTEYIYRDRQTIEEISTHPELPLIVLDHQPQAYRDSVSENAVLQLSGHTHNGQLFPGDILVNLYHRYTFKSSITNGLHVVNNTMVYCTSGYGAWGFPMKTVGRSQILQIHFKYNKTAEA